VRQSNFFPVILAVSGRARGLCGREQVEFLREHARLAVRRSAECAGLELAGLPAAGNRPPQPVEGIYWSLSHKPRYVAGAAGLSPLGIDVELIRPVRERLFRRVLDASERQLPTPEPDLFFFRCWTAKEAVLKQLGVGLAGLSRCRIREVPDAQRMVAVFEKERFEVFQAFFDGHVAAVSVPPGAAVEWRFEAV
jgi:4'-phosphopantetheinyl transferase